MRAVAIDALVAVVGTRIETVDAPEVAAADAVVWAFNSFSGAETKFCSGFKTASNFLRRQRSLLMRGRAQDGVVCISIMFRSLRSISDSCSFNVAVAVADVSAGILSLKAGFTAVTVAAAIATAVIVAAVVGEAAAMDATAGSVVLGMLGSCSCFLRRHLSWSTMVRAQGGIVFISNRFNS